LPAVGSATNGAEPGSSVSAPPEGIAAWDLAAHRSWRGNGSYEQGRAGVLARRSDGKNGKMFASGIRKLCGLACAQPGTGEVCGRDQQKRDELGDNLPPDYVTRVKEGAFYGWPWFYIGNHQDPRHPNERQDLVSKITVPDVLIQPHSAPLGVAFYYRRRLSRRVQGRRLRHAPRLLESDPADRLQGGADTDEGRQADWRV
jgi:glucose/arabinose dehydrogenase